MSIETSYCDKLAFKIVGGDLLIMSRTLVYVNKEKVVGVAVPFIGSEVKMVKQISASGGFNWLLQGEVSELRQEGMTTQIHDLLPETIVNKLLECFPKELMFDNVDSCTRALKAWEQEDNIGKAIFVSGILQIPDLSISDQYDPLSPPDLSSVKTVLYNGESCVIGELVGDGVSLPIYINKDAISMVGYCNNKNVDVIGILGFSPWYNAGKDRTINCILNGIVIWVK